MEESFSLDSLDFDPLTLGVFFGATVLCGIVVYFVSVFGAREQVQIEANRGLKCADTPQS